MVQVARGLSRRIREDPGSILLQVQRASDERAAREALNAARDELMELDGGWLSAPGLSPTDTNGPKYVSPVVPATTGPFIMIDGGHTPPDLLATIPDLVVRHLEHQGVTDGRIAWPRQDGPLLDNGPVVSTLPNAVVLRLYPPPPLVERFQRKYSKVPIPWLDAAATWLAGLGGSTAEVMASVLSVQFSVPASDARSLLEQCRSFGACPVLVTGDLKDRVRTAAGYFTGFEPSFVLAGGGPGATDDELLDIMSALVEVARGFASSVGYAFVSFEPTFQSSDSIDHFSDWYREGGAPPYWVSRVCDELILDAFPYQILGPGHKRRLGGSPPGAEALAGDRIEVSIGDDRREWLLSSPERLAMQAVGRTMLRACLASPEEAHSLIVSRGAMG